MTGISKDFPMDTTPTESSPLMSVGEAHRYLKISRSSLYNLVKEGVLTPVNIVPKRATYLKSDLDAFIESQKARVARDI